MQELNLKNQRWLKCKSQCKLEIDKLKNVVCTNYIRRFFIGNYSGMTINVLGVINAQYRCLGVCPPSLQIHSMHPSN